MSSRIENRCGNDENINNPERDVARQVKDVLGNGLTINDDERYTFGDEFDLEREIGNGNISEKAGKFIKRWPIAEEVLKNLYEKAIKSFHEYDAYTYIHTIQMLNLASVMTDIEFAKITDAIRIPKEKDKRFDFSEADFRDIFLGSIVFHDWGKTKVDRSILNFPGKLDPSKTKEMQKHPIGIVDIIVSEIIDRIFSDIGIKELIEKNRVLREGDTETSNGQSIRGIQLRIKELINIILSSDEYPEEKKLLQMVYLAASHHYNKGYPSHEELDGVLPDYQKWFESSGEEQATILAILDVNDALRSVRAYKPVTPKARTKRILVEDFLSREGSDKYSEIVKFIFNHWGKMQGADNYTKRRKKIENRLKKINNLKSTK